MTWDKDKELSANRMYGGAYCRTGEWMGSFSLAIVLDHPAHGQAVFLAFQGLTLGRYAGGRKLG